MASTDDTDLGPGEAELLAQIATGDRAAFRTLYARYSSPLFALAVRMVGDKGAAEELLQDAFMKMWRHAPSYDGRLSQPFTWAVTIVRRGCIDYLRRQRRRPGLVELPVDAEAPSDGIGRSPRRETQSREETERLLRALGELSPGQRAALELSLFSELSHSEIAERLNEPVGTVKSWIRRGLLDLRATLRNCPL